MISPAANSPPLFLECTLPSPQPGHPLPSVGLLLQQCTDMTEVQIAEELKQVLQRQETLIAEVLGQQGELYRSMKVLEDDLNGVKRQLRKHYGVNIDKFGQSRRK